MKNSLATPGNPQLLSKEIKVPAFNFRMDQPSNSYFGQLPEMTRAGQGRFSTQCTPISVSSANISCGEAALEVDDAEFGDLAAFQELLSTPIEGPAKAGLQTMQSSQAGQPALAVATPQSESTMPPEISETDTVLRDVQSTLDSLVGMAHELSQQKLSAQRAQEALDRRCLQVQEGELRLAEYAERLKQLEEGLEVGRQSLERDAQEQAMSLFERSQALHALEEAVDRRDRAIANRVELLTREEQRVEQQQAHLLVRAAELDEREIALQRLSDDLSAKYTRLVDAKNRLGIIVKTYNEKNLRLVRGALSAIDKTIPTEFNK